MKTIAMKDSWTLDEMKANRQAWIDLLKSGELKQGSGVLYNRKNNCYCVMGVLCKLFGDTFSKNWEEVTEELYGNSKPTILPSKVFPYSDFSSVINGYFVPKNVIKAVGFNYIPSAEYEGNERLLWVLNDSPYNLSFNQLADLISELPYES